MTRYTLYSTWGCHLCVQAEALLTEVGLALQVVDIIDDEQLLQQFRVHIPVLADGDKLLYWPFDEVSVALWLKEPAGLKDIK